MLRVIAQRELRNRNAEIISAVRQGERFIVTRNGKPVAEIRPIAHARNRVVQKAQIIAAFANGPRIDTRQFGADLDRLVLAVVSRAGRSHRRHFADLLIAAVAYA